MLYSNGSLVVALIAVTAQLAGCEKITAKSAKDEHPPAHVEKIDGTDQVRVILTEQAVVRLDVHTTAIRAESTASSKRDKRRSLAPYSSVFYDTAGGAWVFTNSQPLTYVRHRVSVDNIAGEDVFLNEGPPVGTEVVTVGVAELYGFEKGVGH
jgi:hypothetical protein